MPTFLIQAGPLKRLLHLFFSSSSDKSCSGPGIFRRSGVLKAVGEGVVLLGIQRRSVPQYFSHGVFAVSSQVSAHGYLRIVLLELPSVCCAD